MSRHGPVYSRPQSAQWVRKEGDGRPEIPGRAGSEPLLLDGRDQLMLDSGRRRSPALGFAAPVAADRNAAPGVRSNGFGRARRRLWPVTRGDGLHPAQYGFTLVVAVLGLPSPFWLIASATGYLPTGVTGAWMMADEQNCGRTWLRAREAAAVCRVRQSCVHKVAEAHGVRCETRTGHGTWGESTTRVYHSEDLLHLADALGNGTASIDPSWRTDTPQGRRAHLRELLTGCGCLLLIVLVFVLLCVWGLSSDQPGGETSYWH